jgi:uncharacterized membrane protein
MSSNGRGPLARAGIVIGLGLGGFFDGIMLHQVLQWHHLLTDAGFPPDSVENLQMNTLADGLFHVGTYILTVIGVFMLWRARRLANGSLTSRFLIGNLLVGWGLFNLVEWIVDHHVLGIHHVRSGPDQAAWDIAFLVWGALMLIGGWWLARRDGSQGAAQVDVARHRDS